MEENKTGLLKHALTYGLILGLILVVFTVLLYITNLFLNQTLGVLRYVIYIAGIFIAAKTFRDKILGGFISYGRALGYSLIVVFVAAIISSVFNYVLTNYIDPELIEKTLAFLQEKYEKIGLISEDQIDLIIEKGRTSMTALWSIPLAIGSSTLGGFIISLITSAILKKEPNPIA